jgi:hypothetical protein
LGPVPTLMFHASLAMLIWQKVTGNLAVDLLVVESSSPAIDRKDCSIRCISSLFSSRVCPPAPSSVVLSRLLPLVASTNGGSVVIPNGIG